MTDPQAILAGVLRDHRWGGCVGLSTDGWIAGCAGCEWTDACDPLDLFATHREHVAQVQAAALAEWLQTGQTLATGWWCTKCEFFHTEDDVNMLNEKCDSCGCPGSVHIPVEMVAK